MSLFLGNRGTKLYKLEDENMVRKLQGNKERTLFKDPEPLFKDPEERYLKTLSVGPVGVLESRTHDLPRHSPVHNQVSNRCAVESFSNDDGDGKKNGT